MTIVSMQVKKSTLDLKENWKEKDILGPMKKIRVIVMLRIIT